MEELLHASLAFCAMICSSVGCRQCTVADINELRTTSWLMDASCARHTSRDRWLYHHLLLSLLDLCHASLVLLKFAPPNFTHPLSVAAHLAAADQSRAEQSRRASLEASSSTLLGPDEQSGVVGLLTAAVCLLPDSSVGALEHRTCCSQDSDFEQQFGGVEWGGVGWVGQGQGPRSTTKPSH